MAALVAEDEHDFVVGNAAGGGVPDDDALGGANAVDIGVEPVGLFAGLHEEHAVGRDGGSGASYHFLEFIDERGMALGERLELVEDGLEEGRDEEHDNDERQRKKPCAEPVASRIAADDPVEEKHEGRAEEKSEAERLGLIGYPPRPALDADAVGAADVVAVDVEGQAGQAEDDKERSEEEEALHPAAIEHAVHPAFKAGSGAGGEQKPEDGDAPEAGNDVEDVADAVEGNRFGELIGRQGVSLGGRGWGWLRGRGRGRRLGGGRTRGEERKGCQRQNEEGGGEHAADEWNGFSPWASRTCDNSRYRCFYTRFVILCQKRFEPPGAATPDQSFESFWFRP